METQVILTPAHWVYLCGVVAIIATLVCRANVVAPAILATFATAYAFNGSFPSAIESVFYGPLTAARELFNIFLVISLMIAFLNALKRLNADVRMVLPIQKVMVNGHIAFFVLAGVSYLLSLFFWPTPAVPLIAGILLPAAIYAGVPALGAALCIAIAGLGTALSSDFILKVAPGISAKAAAVALPAVADKAMLLSLITGGVALTIAYLKIRKSILKPDELHLERWEATQVTASGVVVTAGASSGGTGSGSASSGGTVAKLPGRDVLTAAQDVWSRIFAIATPVAFLGIVVYMVVPRIVPGMKGPSGAAAAALVGGVAALLMVIAVAGRDWRGICRGTAEHITEGFVFSFRAMSSVLPIAGFFFIGVANTAGPILGLPPSASAPGLLADLVRAGEAYIPHNAYFVSYGILLAGMITGIDGSGFAGLPLTGALAGALGRSVNFDVSTLAAIGQMGSVWTGKTLTAWSALAAVSSFARVPVLQAVRHLAVPVITGLLISTLVAILIW